MAKVTYNVNTTFARVDLAKWETTARALFATGLDRAQVKARLAGPFFAEVDAMIIEDLLCQAIDAAAMPKPLVK